MANYKKSGVAYSEHKAWYCQRIMANYRKSYVAYSPSIGPGTVTGIVANYRKSYGTYSPSIGPGTVRESWQINGKSGVAEHRAWYCLGNRGNLDEQNF